MRGNDTLVFEPGNQFVDALAVPYTVVPAGWRAFLFRLLSPRELGLYLYLCTLCDRNAVCYPSLAQIQADLDVSSSTTITNALKKLEDLGLMLRKRGVLPRRNATPHQNIYQRPAPHYTLLRLLQAGKLDGNLNFVAPGKPGDESPPPTKAAVMALKQTLGDDYTHYDLLAEREARRQFLIERFTKKLNDERDRAQLAFDIFQKRLGLRTLSRLKRHEDDLFSAMSGVIRRHGLDVDENGLPFLILFSRFGSVRDQLKRAIESKRSMPVVHWADAFPGTLSKLEKDVADLLAAGRDVPEVIAELHHAFKTYASAANELLVRVTARNVAQEHEGAPF